MRITTVTLSRVGRSTRAVGEIRLLIALAPMAGIGYRMLSYATMCGRTGRIKRSGGTAWWWGRDSQGVLSPSNPNATARATRSRLIRASTNKATRLVTLKHHAESLPMRRHLVCSSFQFQIPAQVPLLSKTALYLSTSRHGPRIKCILLSQECKPPAIYPHIR